MIPILQGSKNPDADTIPILHENGMIPSMIPKKYGFWAILTFHSYKNPFKMTIAVRFLVQNPH